MKSLDSFEPRDLILWLNAVREDRPIYPAGSPIRPAADQYVRLQCDVDFSPIWAYQLADLLDAAEIKATFSILVGGPFYDVTAASTIEGLDRIQAMGHDFALHFDPRRYVHREQDMEELDAVAHGIAQDVEVLRALGVDPKFANPHRPLRLGFDPAAVPDAWKVTPDDADEVYLSDSAKGFRDASLEYLDDAPASLPDRLRLCLHPAWWVAGGARKETLQYRLTQIAGLLSRDATEWGNMDAHPGALEQDRRDARSGNPARRARAAASMCLSDEERPAEHAGRVVLPTAVEVAAAGNGKKR